jgi:hypothetical protein
VAILRVSLRRVVATNQQLAAMGVTEAVTGRNHVPIEIHLDTEGRASFVIIGRYRLSGWEWTIASVYWRRDNEDGLPMKRFWLYLVCLTTFLLPATRSRAGWSDDVRLTDVFIAYEPQVLARNDTIHVTWENLDVISYMRSVDGGETWDSIMVLTEPDHRSVYADLSLSDNGLLVSWQDDGPNNEETIAIRTSIDGSMWNDPENTCDERYAGQVMHQTATSYLNTERAQSGEFRRILHSKSSYGVEVAFLYSDITPFYNDYYPFAIGGYIWGGFYLDAYLPPGYVVSTDSGCSDYRYEYYRLAGANSSLLESRTFENRFNADAVSTIKILQLTYDAGETVCTVYENIYECPYNNHHPDVVEMVNEFIAQGENYVAIIPELQTRYDQWCGTGILLLDTQTGLGGYVIWGKIVGDGNCPNWGRIYETHGGGTVKEWDIEGYPDLFCTYVSEIPPITIDPPSYEDLYCAEREDYLTFTVHGINFLGGPNSQDECETLGHEDVRQFRLPYTIKEIAENPEWGPNVYTFVIGNRAVNGLCGGSCQTAEKSFTIFKVDKLQYESPGGTWNDISDQSPLYVLKGSTVEFKAVPDPEITWPPDTPIWGGSSGANGTGEIVEVTFNAISESLTDYKTVTAGCEIDGTPTTANVIVYDINELASIVPIMIFEGRSLTRYGLDEWIELSFVTIPEGVTYSQAGGVEWSNTGDGTVRDQYGNGEAYYVAPSTNGQDEIRLTIQTGPSSGQHKSYPRTIVAPSGAYMVQQPGSGIWHRQNTCSVGFYGDEYLLPTDVSFWRLQWKEDSCPGIGQGYYEYLNGAIHPPTPEWRAIAGGDIETGCIIIQDQDVVASSEGPPPFEDGTFDWFIPNLIRTHDEVYELLQANHHQIADETGRCTISKLGAGPFSKDSSDPDSDY